MVVVTYPEHWNVEKKAQHYNFHPSHYKFKDAAEIIVWSSRAHRKRKTKKKDFNLLKVQSISWWVAFTFLIGSLGWVSNGAFAFHEPFSTSKNTDAVKYSALVAGTFFLIGGWAMYLEAINTDHDMDFAQQIIRREELRLEGLVGESKWKWWGMKTYKDIGFTASFMMFIGVSIYQIPVTLGVFLPDNVYLQDTLNWLPQTLGSILFVIASYLFMLEEQRGYFRPHFTSIGWNVGFFSLVGSIGFLLIAVAGFFVPYTSTDYEKYVVNLSTYWSAIAFTVGSAFQYYEAVV